MGEYGTDWRDLVLLEPLQVFARSTKHISIGHYLSYGWVGI